MNNEKYKLPYPGVRLYQLGVYSVLALASVLKAERGVRNQE